MMMEHNRLKIPNAKLLTGSLAGKYPIIMDDGMDNNIHFEFEQGGRNTGKISAAKRQQVHPPCQEAQIIDAEF